MAVASRGDALSAFRELINNDPIKAEKVLLLPSYLPPGLEPVEDPFAMNPATLIGGYGKEASYALRAPDPLRRPVHEARSRRRAVRPRRTWPVPVGTLGGD